MMAFDDEDVQVIDVTVEEITVVVVDQDGGTGPQGVAGANGWTPQHAVIADGERRVIKLANWIGGTGPLPAGVGMYVGTTGLVADIADAIDVRGAIGAQGAQGNPGQPGQVLIGDGANIFTEPRDPVSGDGGDGDLWINTDTQDVFSKSAGAWSKQTNIKGATGDQGPQGDDGANGLPGLNGTNGYSPVIALVVDGQRIVMQVVAWSGGTGTAPATGMYIGSTSLVSDIAQAVNVRGGTGGNGTPGNNGVNGLNFYSGTGAPAGTLGVAGELYLDLAALLLYRKQGTPAAWAQIGSIRGTQGTAGTDGEDGTDGLSFRYGTTDPASGLGVDGETYLNVTTFHVFTKAAGAWSDAGTIRGAQGAAGQDGANGRTIRFGTGSPANSLGVDGDGYIDTAASVLYVKAAGTYTAQGTLKGADGDDGADGADGAAGINGTSMRVGSGAPAQGLGQNGDTYLNTDNFNLYAKSAGAWANLGTIKGADGAAGAHGTDGVNGLSFRYGTAAPTGAVGNDGDTYLQTSNFHIWTRAAGAWTDVGGIKGADGTNGTNGSDGATGAAGTSMRFGSGDPASGLGNNGDVYLNTANYHIFTKAAGAWSDLGSLAGPQGAKGDTGNTGSAGPTGPLSGFSFTFATTGITAPASGRWTLNNSADTATILRVNNTNADASSPVGSNYAIRNWIALAAVSGDPAGILMMQDRNAQVIWSFVVHSITEDTVNGCFVFNVTGTANPSAGSSPTNGQSYVMVYAAAGPKGTTGTAGSAGSNGSNGSNGFNFLSGAGAPASGTGNNGDSYLNTTNGDVYTKAAGAWGSPTGNIKGAQGSAGVGVPTGGITGQVLAKASNTNFDTVWATPSSGGGGGGGAANVKRFRMQFSTATTDADAAAGVFKFSASSIASGVTTMYIDDVDLDGQDVATHIGSIGVSDRWRNVIVRIRRTDIDDLFQDRVAQVISFTTATGYKKLGLVFTQFYDSPPSDAQVCYVQFDLMGGEGFFPAPLSLSNDIYTKGVPGYMPLFNRARIYSASTVYCIPFVTREPLYVNQFELQVTGAAGNNPIRIFVARAHARGGDRWVPSAVMIDTGSFANSLNTAGLKTFLPGAGTGPLTTNHVLPPGRYMLGYATGSTAGATIQTLVCIPPEGSGFWYNGAWGYTQDQPMSADMTTSLTNPVSSANPPGQGGFNATAQGSVAAGFDMPVMMSYQQMGS